MQFFSVFLTNQISNVTKDEMQLIHNGSYSNPTNQQDTKQDLNQPIQSEGATAEKAVSMASGKA